MLKTPGPQQYQNLSKSIVVKGGDSKPFGVNTIRFGKDDNGVPGAGAYEVEGSIKVKQPKR